MVWDQVKYRAWAWVTLNKWINLWNPQFSYLWHVLEKLYVSACPRSDPSVFPANLQEQTSGGQQVCLRRCLSIWAINPLNK